MCLFVALVARYPVAKLRAKYRQQHQKDFFVKMLRHGSQELTIVAELHQSASNNFAL
jgi:hypothetical protein